MTMKELDGIRMESMRARDAWVEYLKEHESRSFAMGDLGDPISYNAVHAEWLDKQAKLWRDRAETAVLEWIAQGCKEVEPCSA